MVTVRIELLIELKVMSTQPKTKPGKQPQTTTTFTHSKYRLGRKPRSFDPRVPHLSALIAGQPQPAPPASVNWGNGMPPNLGMMLNNTLGDCTCAAFYHALQVWSFNADGKSANKMITEPDSDVEDLYILACGYNPRTPGEGPGGNEQHVLNYLLKHGAPMDANAKERDKIVAYVEIDPRNVDDVKRAINACGLVYIGFNVPQNIVPPGGDPPKIWDVDPSDPQIVGGHAVVLPGYDQSVANVISWGVFYEMTWAFFAKYVDEVYAICDHTWFDATDQTPAGLTIKQLESQMQALKA
jgi:hypothetical protein